MLGDRLWLLQRGGGGAAAGIVAELSLEKVMESLRDDLRIDPHELAALRAYDLGTLDGVPVTFSDATPVAQSCWSSPPPRRATAAHPRLARRHARPRRPRPAAADDRPPVQGRGRARHDRHRRHGLPLRVRPGRPGHALAAAGGGDAGRRRARARRSDATRRSSTAIPSAPSTSPRATVAPPATGESPHSGRHSPAGTASAPATAPGRTATATSTSPPRRNAQHAAPASSGR